MFRFVIRKMISKKWMVLALLIGNILLVGITASNPMYTQAVLQRTLNTSLNNYLAEKNRYPGAITIRATGASNRNQAVLDTRDLLEVLPEEYGIKAVERSTVYSLNGIGASSSLQRNERNSITMVVSTIENMNDHTVLVAGGGMSQGVDEDGVLDAIVSERCMIDMQLILGEVLTFERYQQPDGSSLKVRVNGVFRNSDPEDIFWVQSPSSYRSNLFIDSTVFEDWFMTGDMPYALSAVWNVLLDYNAMRADEAAHIVEVNKKYAELYDTIANQNLLINFTGVLENFLKTELKVRTTLWVLQVPIFVLLAAFIFMVSRQMLDMEQGEIAVLKSRGAGRMQVITVYLIQSVVTAALSVAAGLPLAVLLVRVLGSANAFLEFVKRSALTVELSTEALIYAGAAAFLSVCAMVLPVFRHSRVTIVNHKQKKHRKSERPFWQKFFLDFIILGVAVYGLYTFDNQKEYLAQRVLEGASLDPLLFLSSSLFMLGAGLMALRILPLFVGLIFHLFKKWWSPALYASFLRVLRTRNQQGFIMVFLIMTIALGVFDASAARTINSNDEQNLRYMTGADVVVQEVWQDNSALKEENPNIELVYYEPDYGRYETLEGVESLTKVLIDEGGTMNVPKGSLKGVRIMGIDTKRFGQTAWFEESLLPEHWYNYLNAMSQKARAVLLSDNFRTEYDYKIGDAIYFKGSTGESVRGVIYGFVDYWPGYAKTSYRKGSNGLYGEQENYLIVANLSQLQASWGVTPYQVWMKIKGSSQFMYDFAADKSIPFRLFNDTAAKLVAMKNDPVIQGTNGILTVGFIVVLVLCAVGFLIYWVLSIRSRELQFGIFRAMGMSMREIVTMLINEHIFISGAAIGTGAFVGILTARLYMPLIQIAYASSDNALPLRIISQQSDMVRLAIIIGVMVLVCLIVLGLLIKRMKIAQALKLGED